MRAFVLSQFNYCLLVWMFCDRTLKCKVNHVHKSALNIVHKNCKKDFGSIPGQSNVISIHVRNLQLLMTEIFKRKCDLNPPFIKDIFLERNITYSLRHDNDTQLPKAWTMSFTVEPLAYCGSKLCKYLAYDIKTIRYSFYFQKTN